MIRNLNLLGWLDVEYSEELPVPGAHTRRPELQEA
jgi:hypothetical protein